MDVIILRIAERYFQGKFLYNNYKQAVTIIDEYSEQLATFANLTGYAAPDFEAWYAEEKAYLKSVSTEVPVEQAKSNYVDALQKLGVLRWVRFAFYVASNYLISLTLGQRMKTRVLLRTEPTPQQTLCVQERCQIQQCLGTAQQKHHARKLTRVFFLL